MNSLSISSYQMKNMLLIFLCTIISALCKGQNQLIGVWTNSYQSTLDINFQSQGQLRGEYKSSTGSTGKYAVIGSYSPIDESGNVAVSLTISWNSLDGSTKDPSQFWTSVMIGTYYSETGTMEIINQITAAKEFDAVNVKEPGIYPESLTFTKKQNTHTVKETASYQDNKLPVQLVRPKSMTVKLRAQNNIVGTWVNSDPTSPYRSISIIEQKNDTIQARIALEQYTIPAIGLVAAPSTTFQSLSIASYSIYSAPTTSSLPSSSTVNALLGLSGLLEVSNNNLKLVISKARNVAEKNKYASTDINVYYFNKKGYE